MNDIIESVSALGLEQPRPFEVVLVDTAMPVDSLMSDRDAAAAKLARLSKFDDAINESEMARQTANSALRDFLNNERICLLAWAESAGVSDPPRRDVDNHKTLADACEDADRRHEAALAARGTVEPSVARARAALHKIQVLIDSRIAQSIAADALRECEELNELCASAKILHARIICCREALYRKASTLRENKDFDRGAPWGHAAGQFADIGPKLFLAPTQADIQAHFGYWNQRINNE